MEEVGSSVRIIIAQQRTRNKIHNNMRLPPQSVPKHLRFQIFLLSHFVFGSGKKIITKLTGSSPKCKKFNMILVPTYDSYIRGDLSHV